MEENSFFASSRWQLLLVLIILFGAALAIRIYDITDLPLDFHPTRQLFSALKARGFYYADLQDSPNERRQMALLLAKNKVTLEPEILEHLAAFTYRFSGEQLWIPRLYSILFWLTGGIFLVLLARELISTNGAMLALAYYLFLPYAIYASRSFQPDPLMVTLILAFWWLIFRWGKTASWTLAVLAGVVGGFAILVKLVAAFFVVGGAVGAALGRFKLSEIFRNGQVWIMALLGIIPGAAWVIYGVFIKDFLRNRFGENFISSLLISPQFYLNWQNKASAAAGGVWIMLGLLGLVMLREKPVRTFLFGLWGAYLAFGLYFNYRISTHDYYSLALIPIVALSLAPLGDGLFSRLSVASSSTWTRAAVYIILSFGLFSSVWFVRNQMKSVDYRPQAVFWNEVSSAIGQNKSVVALTEDYGMRLAYWGWQSTTAWPSYGDLYQSSVRGNPKDIDRLFDEVAASKTYFLVTDMNDFKKQPQLRKRLAEYPIIAEGKGYLIYDLQHPLEDK